MPVEETGNMLILVAAIARMEGNADFAGRYWPRADQVGRVPQGQGLRPREPAVHRRLRRPPRPQRQPLGQGHRRPRRLRAAGRDCAARRRWRRSTAALAEQFAARWVKEAADGDHFRLAFDQPGTWSQKYNLVWDRLLGLNLFPARGGAEGDGLLPQHAGPYGLPLDNRRLYTKLDWITWTATLTGRARRLRRAGRARSSLPQHDAAPRADDRLVLDARRRRRSASRRGRSWAASSCGCSTSRPCGRSGPAARRRRRQAGRDCPWTSSPAVFRYRPRCRCLNSHGGTGEASCQRPRRAARASRSAAAYRASFE